MVKIAGRDVMLSKKIMISIVMVPLLWIFYAVLMVLLTDWELSTKVSSVHSIDSQPWPLLTMPLLGKFLRYRKGPVRTKYGHIAHVEGRER